MPVVITQDVIAITLTAIPKSILNPISIDSEFFASIPAGSLRISGDAPDGLVLHGVAPVSRILDLFDSLTNVHVATTTSSALNGTYEFPNLSDRTYFVICRGISGERDQIYNGVSPV